jgi:arginyl-tRNA synthetase
MNVYKYFIEEIHTIVADLQSQGHLPPDLPLSRIVVEPPRDLTHGDLATNVAMVLSHASHQSPHQIAAQFLERLQHLSSVKKAEIAGPGFINLSLTSDFWLNRLRDILNAGETYGETNIGQGQSINVEYVSVNPTGPMHIGHCRGAIVGDVLASLLEKAGYRVTREFYMNDAGGQANELARSTYKRYLQALGREVGDIGSYGGDYLIPVGKELAEQMGSLYADRPESEWLEPLRNFAVQKMMARIKQDLNELSIHHDIFSSEFEMLQTGKVDEAVNILIEKELVYMGTLEKPKGKEIEDWEPREQLLFKSTAFGDDVDRPLKKSDGYWTYFANDIAYHFSKYGRGSRTLVNIWGADHGGYIKRLIAAVKAVTSGDAEVHCLLCQMVRFIKQGKALKMSKREGTFITVHEALEQVGLDAIRFMMVSRKNDAPLDFDFSKVVEHSKENPVFYVQYAYARCHSIKKHILAQFPHVDLSDQALAQLSFSHLDHQEFIALIKKLVSWPRLIEQAARTFEPHRVTYYLMELAADFHELWTQGQDAYHLRFIDPHNAEKTQMHFALVSAVAKVLSVGLKILGIKARESM